MSVDRKLPDMSVHNGEKLLLCPFCGSKPVFELRQGEWGYKADQWYVGCSSCGYGWSEPAEKWIPDVGTVRKDHEAKTLLREKWNRRQLFDWRNDAAEMECLLAAAAASNGGELRIIDRDRYMAKYIKAEWIVDKPNRLTILRVVNDGKKSTDG